MKVYINGYEIPTFCYKGSSDYLVIIAEDLTHYGFSRNWNDELKSLTATYDENNSINPLNMDLYPKYDYETPILPIYKINRSVSVNYKDKSLVLNNFHVLDGYIAISADELAEIAQSKLWDGNTGSLYIEF